MYMLNTIHSYKPHTCSISSLPPTYCHEDIPNGLLGSPIHGACGEGCVEQLVMGHDVSDGTEQSLDLVPVNGRAGHVLEWLHVNLWRRGEQRRN